MPRKTTKYDFRYCAIARQLGERGATYPQIAEAIGVSMRHLMKWENEHREFFDALTPAYKHILRRQIAARLEQRARDLEEKNSKKRKVANAL